MKANSDLKHAKDSLAAEKKKKRTLEKNIVDVSIMFNRVEHLTVDCCKINRIIYNNPLSYAFALFCFMWIKH